MWRDRTSLIWVSEILLFLSQDVFNLPPRKCKATWTSIPLFSSVWILLEGDFDLGLGLELYAKPDVVVDALDG